MPSLLCIYYCNVATLQMPGDIRKDFEPENIPALLLLLDVFIWMLYKKGISTRDSTNSEEKEL